MKYKFFILLFPICLTNLYGQTFQLTKPGPYNQYELNLPVKIYLIKNKIDTIGEFTVYPAETEIEPNLEIVKLNKFSGFKQKIKVEIDETGCCTSISTYYFLVDTRDKIYILPGIGNTHCDGPEPKYDLIFPDSRFGVPNAIIKAKLMYNDNFEVVKHEEISRLHFQGSNFIETMTRNTK